MNYIVMKCGNEVKVIHFVIVGYGISNTVIILGATCFIVLTMHD